MNGLLGHRPQIDGGLLGPVTANRNLLAQGVNSRNKAPIQMKPMTLQTGLDGAAMATSPIPILGDLIGLGADAYRFATDPSSRTPANFGLAALGALPMVPPAMAIFAGPLAKTAKLDAKELAEGMERAGRSRDDIWKETGWFKGPEGKWKFEIDDSASTFQPKSRINEANKYLKEKGFSGDVGSPSVPIEARKDALYYADYRTKNSAVGHELSHGDLFDAYPYMKHMPLKHENIDGILGGYHPDKVSISLSDPMINAPGGGQHSTLLHELQHAVQGKEGFARGGTPSQFSIPDELKRGIHSYDDMMRAKNLLETAKLRGVPVSTLNPRWLTDNAKAIAQQYERMPNGIDALLQNAEQINRIQDPMDAYRRLAGEAEARAVQSRMNMPPAQRQATPPWQSYDVPWDQLIIK